METAIKIGTVLVVCYVGLVGCVYAIQRAMMYFPAGDLPSPAAAGAPEMSEVRLKTADGLDLIAWYRPAAAAGKAAIVYFHGNGGHIGMRVYKVRPFLDAGYGLLLVSYRGYGGNPGSPSEEGLFMDGRAALAFLAERSVAPERTVLLGESLGSGVAVRMASEHAVGALLLEAPFTSAADVGQRAYPFLPVKLMIKDRFDSLAIIDQVRVPLLIVHGERDGVVPVPLGREVFAAGA